MHKESGATIKENNTYIQNPGYPSPQSDSANINYKIEKLNEHICDIRLDFKTFAIQGPSTTTLETAGGKCDVDSFDITVRDKKKKNRNRFYFILFLFFAFF